MIMMMLWPDFVCMSVSLIHLWERLRSIVMSMSLYVCLFVCLSVCEDISGTTCTIFTKLFVHVASVHGSVLWHVDDRLHRLSAGRGWWECTARAKCNLWLPCLYCLICIAMNVCRSLKTVLSAWLETYPNDFREPPEYSTLNSLVQFAICNAYDNELAQKARDQLSSFRERDSSEHIASGLGMCSLSQLITAELC